MERDEAVLRALNESVESNDFTVYPGIFLTSLRSAGWVVVPVEATEAMLTAGKLALRSQGAKDDIMRGILAQDERAIAQAKMLHRYRAMIAEFTPPAEGKE